MMMTNIEFLFSTLVTNDSRNQKVVTQIHSSTPLNDATTMTTGCPCNSTTLQTPTVGLNEQIMGQFSIFFNCFLLHFLSLFGIITNIFSVLVLSRHTFKETTTILLLSLSINDLICSLTQPYRRLECFFEQFDPLMALTVRSISVVYLFAIPDVFVSISICHTTAIAIERVVAVCFPFHVSRIFTPYRVKWMVGFLYVYSISMMSPMLTIFNFVWIYDPKFNATRGAYILNPFYSENYEVLDSSGITGLTNLFLTSPLMVIMLCSVVICVRLTTIRRKHLVKMSSNQVKDMRVVKMLLAVCVVTFCVSLPSAIIELYVFYSDISILTTGKLHYLLHSIVCCLYQLNASVNFIIYVTMSYKFENTTRKLFRRIIGKCCPKN